MKWLALLAAVAAVWGFVALYNIMFLLCACWDSQIYLLPIGLFVLTVYAATTKRYIVMVLLIILTLWGAKEAIYYKNRYLKWQAGPPALTPPAIPNQQPFSTSTRQ